MSDSGKSMVTAALVKLFHGTPFKAQNMSLNSYPTKDGGEISFIQAYQAMGSGLSPERIHNPVLLKPSPGGVEVVLMGSSIGLFKPGGYYDWVSKAWTYVRESVRDTSVIEGAGGIAEPNFMDRDLSGFLMAKELKLPIVLVLDIDRGGAFASAYGAYSMFPPSLRDQLKGFIINKFRGDPVLLQPAIDWLSEKTGMKHFGTIPYADDFDIMAEDSMNVKEFGDGSFNVSIVSYPYMSNFNEFQALSKSNASVRFVRKPSQAKTSDLIILPGTKSSYASLKWLIERGFSDVIKSKPVLAICGGFQMLGRKLVDPYGLESPVSQFDGLGLLDVDVIYDKKKRVKLVRGRGPFGEVTGYEVRRGSIIYHSTSPLLDLDDAKDGAYEGQIMALSVHGSLYSEFGRNAVKEFGLRIWASSLEDEVKTQIEFLSRRVKEEVDVEGLRALWEESMIPRV